jgi:hypothetical protein
MIFYLQWYHHPDLFRQERNSPLGFVFQTDHCVVAVQRNPTRFDANASRKPSKSGFFNALITPTAASLYPTGQPVGRDNLLCIPHRSACWPRQPVIENELSLAQPAILIPQNHLSTVTITVSTSSCRNY